MPISTTLLLTTKNGNKIKTQNITYVNPNAADSDLSTFMASFCGLSKNEFVSLNRVDKHELTVQTGKKDPQLSADDVNMGKGFEATTTVTRLGDGAISVTGYSDTPNVDGTTITFYRPDQNDFEETVTISVAETDEYAAASITITVSGSLTKATPR